MLQKIQVTTQTNTRAGDALHLRVALQCKAKAFVTLDIAQAASAKQLGFDVVTISQKSLPHLARA